MTDDLKPELIRTATAMNRRGLNVGTSGNLSVRCEGGMLITPSGMKYESLQEGDVVFVDDEGHASGGRKPSSEWRIHHDIYRTRDDARAILHAHPACSAALACLNEAIPAFHYMVAVAGGRNIRCVPYATFGTQALSDLVIEGLRGRKACLMANHGLLCLDRSLETVLDLATEIEQLAKTYLLCLSAGSPVVLDDREMDRVIDRFRDYGSR